MMIIKIKDIGKSGLDATGELSSEYIGLTKEDYVHFITPLAVQARLDRVDDFIIAKVKVAGTFESFCCQTLKPITLDWKDDFILDLSFEEAQEEIDLGDEIRQEVILRLPVKLYAEGVKEGKFAPQEELDRPVETHKPFSDLKWE